MGLSGKIAVSRTCDARESRHFRIVEMQESFGGDELCPTGGDEFQHLPARSRTPVYIPHGMEIALPAPPSLGSLLAARPKFENLPPTADFGWNGADRTRFMSGAPAAAAAEVNITNNTTVLVVDVPVKPIEKLRRAVKKMQRVSGNMYNDIF